MNMDLYAAFDANINRCSEGLRVCEDLFRFYARNTALSSRIKEVRHSLRDASKLFGTEILVSSRDVENDGQKFVDTESEGKRGSVSDLFMANIKRAQESLRFMEEASKMTSSPGAGAVFQRIRFGTYEIEKEGFLFLKKSASLSRLEKSTCRMVSMKSGETANFKKDKVSTAGADIIFFDRGTASDSEYLNASLKLREICAGLDILFFIVSRCDMALLCRADGIILAEGDISKSAAEKIMPASSIIGRIFSSEDDIPFAQEENADFILIDSGPENILETAGSFRKSFVTSAIAALSDDENIIKKLNSGFAVASAYRSGIEILC